MHPTKVLERYWNYTSFRPHQEAIIGAILDNEDTFVLLPTGGGKSICFQIPALLKDGICIVISPLIALMKNQVDALKQKGIKAIELSSGLSYKELDAKLDNCIYGNYKFLYLSPERLQQPLVKERLQKMQVNLIVVDEAHCISEWGNDFRPAYKNISQLRALHPHVNCVALTATAKHNIIDAIMANLDFVSPKVFKGSFLRQNIAYKVLQTEDKLYKLLTLLKHNKTSAIIYVRSRRATVEVNTYLKENGLSSTFFHGGITKKEKQQRLYQWLQNQKQIMVATTAFGMGIDKPDVGLVIHYNLPESLESYYQEAGRAGRNGEDALAVILHQPIDAQQLKQQFLNVLPSFYTIKIVYRKLNSYFQVAYGEGEQETYQFDFQDFCSTYNLNAKLSYNALLALDRNGIISLSQAFKYKTKIQFLVTNAQLFKYLETHLELNTIIKILLRTYGGIFNFETTVDLDLIQTKTSLNETTVITQLKQLQKDGIIDLFLMHTDANVTFLKPREDEITINPIKTDITQQIKVKRAQVNAVLKYVHNTTVCRSKQLLAYFEDVSVNNCGKCSVCLKNKTNNGVIPQHEIGTQIQKFLKNKALSSRDLLENIPCDEEALLNVLSNLVAAQIIKININNTYSLK